MNSEINANAEKQIVTYNNDTVDEWAIPIVCCSFCAPIRRVVFHYIVVKTLRTTASNRFQFRLNISRTDVYRADARSETSSSPGVAVTITNRNPQAAAAAAAAGARRSREGEKGVPRVRIIPTIRFSDHGEMSNDIVYFYR